jgi:Bacterial lipoate protein ligase C-terminus
MGKLHYVYKSSKLIHILLEHLEKTSTQDYTISSIMITGDFFVYPEENLDKLEASLIGTELKKSAVKQKIYDGCVNLRRSVLILSL